MLSYSCLSQRKQCVETKLQTRLLEDHPSEDIKYTEKQAKQRVVDTKQRPHEINSRNLYKIIIADVNVSWLVGWLVPPVMFYVIKTVRERVKERYKQRVNIKGARCVHVLDLVAIYR